ncbi:MAG TPA: polyprenyl synthetase family protein [Bacteroidetes bacterium]|nr:polyprenyl synthetase family protein [Ignavibacteria bacterium]HCA42254.1 polyprenyl synthetase family protein [Bacteroidota bacterium]HCN36929.1 polyprenyl synthetase family protein [Bacteroidota bacterium]
MTEFLKKYDYYKSIVDKILMEVTVDKKPDSLYKPIDYILSWKGKRIRPSLLIFSCESMGGNPEKSFNAAAAIEILHNFTLVHDDIMDNADTRRGRETIHKKWNTDTAILAGDEMIGLAYSLLAKTKSENISEIFQTFTNGIIEVCEGQAFDKEFEVSDNVNLDDYLMMIRKKTSRLLEVCTVIGGYIANTNSENIEVLRMYAENLGTAFQINDDLLDLTADELNFGKKIGGDIRERKKTYLALKANQLVTDKDDLAFLNNLFSIKKNFEINDADINKVKNIYEKFGVIENTRQKISDYTNKANDCLKKLKNSTDINSLVWFSEMLLNRNY